MRLIEHQGIKFLNLRLDCECFVGLSGMLFDRYELETYLNEIKEQQLILQAEMSKWKLNLKS